MENSVLNEVKTCQKHIKAFCFWFLNIKKSSQKAEKYNQKKYIRSG